MSGDTETIKARLHELELEVRVSRTVMRLLVKLLEAQGILADGYFAQLIEAAALDLENDQSGNLDLVGGADKIAEAMRLYAVTYEGEPKFQGYPRWPEGR